MQGSPGALVRWLKVASLALIIVGLAVIYVASLGISAPLVRVSDVYGNYAMNYAVVRLRGNVTGPPYVDVSSGKITMKVWINDGSGSIGIYAYDAQARRLLSEGVVPMPGDVVEVEGQVRVRDQYTYVILQLAEQLRIVERPSGYLRVDALDTSMGNRAVSVEGVASGLRNVSSGLLFSVDTGGGEVTVLIPKILKFVNADLYAGLSSSLEGARVRVSGVVYLYKGVSPEIVVRSFEEIAISESVPRVRVGELGRHVGETVSLEANLSRIFYSKGVYIVEVYDETGKTNVTVPKNVMLSVDPKYMFTPNRLVVVGRVSESGSLTASSIKPREQPPKITAVGSATEVGVAVALRGRASGLYVGSKGYAIFTLTDDTGSIKVYVPGWSHVPEDVRRAVGGGGVVTVYGYIDVYRGELEVVVYNSMGIEVGQG